jgi:hypothetical protein
VIALWLIARHACPSHLPCFEPISRVIGQISQHGRDTVPHDDLLLREKDAPAPLGAFGAIWSSDAAILAVWVIPRLSMDSLIL